MKTKEKYAYVAFSKNGFKYIYKCGPNIKVGNVVNAPTLNYSMSSEAVVTRIVKLDDDHLPIEKNKILTLTEVLDKKYVDPKIKDLRFMKRMIIRKYLREWEKGFKNDWVIVYRSNYGASISYEKDGVLEVYYGDIESEEWFFEYTITTTENLKTKLNYVKTITHQLFYKEIDEQTFLKYLDKV